MVAPLVDQRGHALTLALPHAPAVVSGDRERLAAGRQQPAQQRGPVHAPGGRIHVELRILDSGGAEISVRDNGPGIPSHQLTDIFNIFVQGEHNSESGGLGLGLSLVQQLVTLHRGAVSAFSTGQPGEGSEFVVRLPLVRAPAPDANREPSRRDSLDQARPRSGADRSAPICCRPHQVPSSLTIVQLALGLATVAPTTLISCTVKLWLGSTAVSPRMVTANDLLVAPAGIDCPDSIRAGVIAAGDGGAVGGGDPIGHGTRGGLGEAEHERRGVRAAVAFGGGDIGDGQRGNGGPSTRQVLEQPSPFIVSPSSHCSRPCSVPLPQLDAGVWPMTLELLRGPGCCSRRSRWRSCWCRRRR